MTYFKNESMQDMGKHKYSNTSENYYFLLSKEEQNIR